MIGICKENGFYCVTKDDSTFTPDLIRFDDNNINLYTLVLNPITKEDVLLFMGWIRSTETENIIMEYVC